MNNLTSISIVGGITLYIVYKNNFYNNKTLNHTIVTKYKFCSKIIKIIICKFKLIV